MKKPSLVGAIALGLALAATVVVGAAAFYVFHVVPRRVEQVLASARLDRPAAPEVRVVAGPLRRQDAVPPGVRAFTAARGARDGASAFGRLHLATPGGLAVHGPDGERRALLTWLEGLGCADATAVVRHGARLAVGAADGSVTLVGESDAQVLRFDAAGVSRHGTAAVVDLAVDGTTLLVATFGAGLLEWTGGDRARVTPAVGAPVREVTALAVGAGGVAVGTSSGAVLVRREGRLVPLELGPGAPVDRITALAWRGDELLVGTPLGLLAVAEGRGARSVRGDLFVTSLLVDPGAATVLAATFDDGVVAIAPGGGVERRLLGGEAIARLRLVEGRPVAFGAAGAWSLATDHPVPLVRPTAAPLAGAHVTALARHGGELLVGTFEDGVDVLGPEGRPVRHLPSPGAGYGLDQVNAIAASPERHDLLVATVRGLIEIAAGDGTFAERRLGRAEGLVGEQVQALAHGPGGRLALATNRGATVREPGGALRSLGALHGLANDHCYAVAYGAGGRLYVGTLGGLSVVSPGLRVERSLRAGNRELRAAWVTALAPAPEGMYVGTYGGGVALVAPSGRVDDVGRERPRLRVNPGALAVRGDRLYVGTLDDGLLVLDRTRRAWLPLELPLGSPNVTAVLPDEDGLWIGTDGGLVRVGRAPLEEALARAGASGPAGAGAVRPAVAGPAVAAADDRGAP